MIIAVTESNLDAHTWPEPFNDSEPSNLQCGTSVAELARALTGSQWACCGTWREYHQCGGTRSRRGILLKRRIFNLLRKERDGHDLAELLCLGLAIRCRRPQS